MGTYAKIQFMHGLEERINPGFNGKAAYKLQEKSFSITENIIDKRDEDCRQHIPHFDSFEIEQIKT